MTTFRAAFMGPPCRSRMIAIALPAPPRPPQEGGEIGKGKEKGRKGDGSPGSEDEKTRASRAHFMGYLIRSLIVQRRS